MFIHSLVKNKTENHILQPNQSKICMWIFRIQMNRTMIVNTVVDPDHRLCECSKRLIGKFCGHRNEKLSFSLDKRNEILGFLHPALNLHYFASSATCTGACTDKILSSFNFWQTKKKVVLQQAISLYFVFL